MSAPFTASGRPMHLLAGAMWVLAGAMWALAGISGFVAMVKPAAAETIYVGNTTPGQAGYWRPGLRRPALRSGMRETGYGGPATLIRHLHGLGYHQIVFANRVGHYIGITAIDPSGNRVQLAVDVRTGGIVEARILGPARNSVPEYTGSVRQAPPVLPADILPTEVSPRAFAPPLPKARPTIAAAVPRAPIATVGPNLAAPPPDSAGDEKLRAEKNPLVVY